MRIRWIDSWRGILMLFVVIGHVVGMACHFSSDGVRSFMVGVYKVIYVFHMPAFFFLAGVTWKRKIGETFVAYLIKKTKRLIVPYFVFGFFSALFYYFMSASFFKGVAEMHDGYYVAKSPATAVNLLLSLVHAGGWPENGVFRGNSVLWFLPALFSAEIFYWIIDKVCHEAKWQILIVGALYVCSFFMPERLPWGVSRALNLLAFLAIGRWCIPLMHRSMHWWHVSIIAAFYVIACCTTPNHGIVHKSLLWYIAFDMLGIVGIFMSYKLAECVADKAWIQRIGMEAMGIMLSHKYVIVVLQSKVVSVRTFCQAGYLASIFMVIALTVITVAVSYVFSCLVRRFCPFMFGEFARKG